jgi:hypothetical protein
MVEVVAVEEAVEVAMVEEEAVAMVEVVGTTEELKEKIVVMVKIATVDVVDGNITKS